MSKEERELTQILHQLKQSLQSHNYKNSQTLLSRAKIILLHLNALVPDSKTSRALLILGRETLEIGALISIRLKDPEAFTRYFLQLQPFYDVPDLRLPKDTSQKSKVTGLYLLLLLSQGDYAGFHTVLESLELTEKKRIEEDRYIEYPISLERSLMEGSYDKVWRSTKSESVPSEEFGLFSEVLVGTIRSEIASCSEKAYPSLPITNAKNLLYLDSEGAVIEFAQERGWVVKDGRIYFPEQQEGKASERDILVASGQVIENTIGYARELETIV
ncbi:MAG: regulatory particle non-ATPase [Cirrosporium novae-zelandiae]|nr:MAG: regulatory particle non-ATPase [Cirrosporium novae-zelandiae]